MASAPADHGSIEGSSLNGFGWPPDKACRSVRCGHLLDAAAKWHLINNIRAFELPRISPHEPISGKLLLPSITEALAEQAVLVADTVAVGREPEAG